MSYRIKHFAIFSILLTFLTHFAGSQSLAIEFTTAAISVDGQAEGTWDSFDFQSIDNPNSGDVDSPADLSARYKIAFDATNIYVLLEVRDNVWHIDNETNVWNEDGFELFIDVGNDKQSTYGSDDFKFDFRYTDNNSYKRNNRTTGVQIAQMQVNDTVVYEVAIPLSTLTLEQSNIVEGELIGFDIHVNDDDNTGNREGKLAWYARKDESSKNPAYFGIAKFTGIDSSDPANKPNFSHDRGFFDSPFTLTISSDHSNATVYYTLDGSDPLFSATRLEASAPVELTIDPDATENRGGKTPGVIVRATNRTADLGPSKVVTKSYFFPEAIAKQGNPGGHWVAPRYDFAWPGLDRKQNMDYAMSQSITSSSKWGDFKEAMLDIPTYSLVTDYDYLFDDDQGIYMNALEDGWERPVSIEMIEPKTEEGFQIDGGIRIRGRYSRLPRNAKHSFRLMFRNEYGQSRLEYPVFGDEGTNEFKRLDFRTAQNSSWQTEESHETVTFLKEVFARDTQGKMGMAYTRSRYCHLYLNGVYWGLYQIQERAEETFSETYLGGNKSDYDIIKPRKNVPVPVEDLKMGAIEGTMESAERLWNKVLAGMESNEAYFEVQGMNPDGTRNASFERLLDVESLIDYLLISFYVGSQDGPGVVWQALWGKTLRPNNYIGIYNRSNPDGFKWIVHDFEKTMYSTDESFPLTETDDSWFSTDITFMNPVTIHRYLMKNPEYRLKFADRVYRYFEGDGVFVPENVRAAFDKRKAEIQLAVIGEAARWGDMISWKPANTPDNWESNVANLFNNYIPSRTTKVIDQFKQIGAYTDQKAPYLSTSEKSYYSGLYSIGSNSTLNFTNPNSTGTIYYTLDGSDPRTIGGQLLSNAIEANSSTTLAPTSATIVMARIKNGENWSALLETELIVETNYEPLKITEIHYNPLDANGIDGSELEFLEIKNTGSSSIDLNGLSLSDGVTFSFGSGTVGAGAFIVLASNSTAFESHYGFAPFGEYEGQLRNSGERIALSDFNDELIWEVSYSDDQPWPLTPDGAGNSLVSNIINPTTDPNSAAYWKASTNIGGSPEADDPNQTIAPLIINEISANPFDNEEDAIELYNPSSAAVNVENWYLTDDRDEIAKWKIHAGKSVPANGYLVFRSSDFGSAFSLSSHGEEVFLFAADATGDLLGYSHGVVYGEQDAGVTFGQHINSQGQAFFVAQQTPTLGSENDEPKHASVIISEIMYHPEEGSAEYVKLTNTTDEAVTFNGAESEAQVWKLNGTGFDFPPSTVLNPGSSLFIIEAEYDADLFRESQSLPETIHVFNMSGGLDNSGETLTLERPGPFYDDNGTNTFEYIIEEFVKYGDSSPWPAEADGMGASLNRTTTASFANDPQSWEAISRIAPPSLSPDENTVNSLTDVTITFTDDSAWRDNITEVKVNGTVISSDDYAVSAGQIIIKGNVFQFKQSYEIVIEASGYFSAVVTQVISEGEAPSLSSGEDFEIRIFPNPASDILQISVGELIEKGTLKVTDMTGRTLIQQDLKANNTLNVSDWKTGLYLVIIQSNSNVYKSKLTVP
ncbi:MAG: lamin tail domain-containing protein [Cyclobacteriaceae bacterium]